ncbi:2,3-diketo-5-methylthio-1-phosphopentane phosphatase [Lipomyces oligophaga]|uniref:2,3-diketo-5-methylthio-1-phosphopentane phosphatase n=1 Tax=Lipomyces oligophaga TaxID=45792 RepID=UPI0034CFBA7A
MTTSNSSNTPSAPSPSTTVPTRKDVAIFSDFDGTIFLQDTGHVLFDRHGCGKERREVLDGQINSGERSFRDVSEEMWGSLNVPFDKSMQAMKEHLEIDPDFHDFHDFCDREGISFSVVSAGIKPVLRGVLNQFLGHSKANRIDILSNDAHINHDGSSWKVLWRHDTSLGHDKSLTIKECRALYRKSLPANTNPLIIFIGDGVSDLPAAREADVLFARSGLRLEEYCLEHKIDYIPYNSFADIQREVSRILDSGDLERFKKPANRQQNKLQKHHSSFIAGLGARRHFLGASVETRSKSRRTDKAHMSPLSARFGQSITIA